MTFAEDVTVPRNMLGKLRTVMAAPMVGQERLNAIVADIAQSMKVEACTIYVRGTKGGFELRASHEPDGAKIPIKEVEGLVSAAAQSGLPLRLADARTHKAFVKDSKVGDYKISSFLGIPIFYGGIVEGVLVLQSQRKRDYKDTDVEVMQTVAMILAEMLAGIATKSSRQAVERASHYIKASGFVEGMAIGHAIFHEPKITVAKLLADNIPHEQERLKKALRDLRVSIDLMLTTEDLAHAGEHREILEVYRMFANNEGWHLRLLKAIGDGLTAEASVEHVQRQTRLRLLRKPLAYMRDRLQDFEDLSKRLLRHLSGAVITAAEGELPEDTIIIARNMGPAELLDYPRDRLKGVILEEGNRSAHVAVVSRALGLPLVGRVSSALKMADSGDRVVMDGFSGEVYIRPSQKIIQAYEEKLRFQKEKQQKYETLRTKPCVSRDGVDVDLFINAGLLMDLPSLAQSGAMGIGLFRTELQFLVSSTLPRLKEQIDFYKQVANSAKDKRVVFRTLDIGGDKAVPYMNSRKEENPALGWRSLRMALDRPALLRYQIRALLIALAGRPLHIMLPMVTDVAEVITARGWVTKEIARCQKLGYDLPSQISVGAMMEVPALAWQMDRLAQHIDFLCVGSNDLLQFFYACDRNNTHLMDRYDPLHQSSMRFFHHIKTQSQKYDIPVTFCGEMSGSVLEAMALIGLGFRSLSIAPASVGAIKMMVMQLPVQKLEKCMLKLLQSPNQEMRPHLERFAQENAIALA